MNQHRLLLLPAVAMTAVLLVACGGGDGGGGFATGEGTEDGLVVQMDGESREDYLGRLYEAAKEEGAVAYYTAANESETEVITENWNEMYPGIELEPVSASGPRSASSMVSDGSQRNSIGSPLMEVVT